MFFSDVLTFQSFLMVSTVICYDVSGFVTFPSLHKYFRGGYCIVTRLGGGNVLNIMIYFSTVTPLRSTRILFTPNTPSMLPL